MKIKIHSFTEDEQSKELYKLVILVKAENTETDKKYVREKLSDFQYEHLEDCWIRMVRRGHFLQLYVGHLIICYTTRNEDKNENNYCCIISPDFSFSFKPY
jgi:hypothetical protein